MVVQHCLGIDLSQLVVRYDEECRVERLEQIISDLQQGRPVQYILGEAEFCELNFKVSEGVLIPRPETEELVYNVVQHAKPNSRIVDIGTGSGAIAIALAHHLPEAEVVAVDISPRALEIAKSNAERLGVEVQFVEADALGDLTPLGEFDVVVSNPPYIPQSDISAMRVNVVDFEPHNALFVPDDDALCFYRSIAENASKMLREGGSVWFEIYEEIGAEVCAELERCGFKSYEVLKDANDKDRVVWATR
jgi:release factor glutamine methyltransferase